MPEFKTPDGNSPATFAKIIEKFCPYFEKEEQRKKDRCFADFCKIGALLQDSKVCNQNLAKLNEAMELKYQQKLKQAIATYKMSNANADPVGMKFQDVKNAPKGPSGYLPPPKVKSGSGVPVLDADRFKFWGSLNATLSEKEAVWGFNEDSSAYGSARGKVALLTGNVHQEVFRKDLLVAGRHWKDPMVPEGHGEFSHRLQWYIVCAEQEHKFGGETYKLEHDGPVLMFAMALNRYMLNKTLTGEDRWMWDLLFDSFYNRQLAADFGQTKTFRSPEFMMSTYRSKLATGTTADLLSLFIRYRLDKRVAMNLNKTDDDGAEAAKEYLKTKLAKWGIPEADYTKFAGKDGVAESGRVIFNQKA